MGSLTLAGMLRIEVAAFLTDAVERGDQNPTHRVTPARASLCQPTPTIIHDRSNKSDFQGRLLSDFMQNSLLSDFMQNAPKRLHAEFAEGVHVAVVGSGVSLVRGGAVARWTWDGSKDRAAVEPAAGGSGHEFRGRQPRRGRSAGVGARVEIMTGAS